MEEFEGIMSAEVRRQEKLDIIEEKNFRREELLGKYMAKMLYGQNDGKFEKEYLRKLEKTGENRSQFLWRRNLKREVMLKLKAVGSIYFLFF